MEKENKFIKNIAKGIFISLIATIVFLLIFSIILTYSNVKEDIINPVIIIITAISILNRKFNFKHENRKNGIVKWMNNRRILHINNIYNIKHTKLGIWIEFTSNYINNRWNCIWNFRWYNWSK